MGLSVYNPYLGTLSVRLMAKISDFYYNNSSFAKEFIVEISPKNYKLYYFLPL